MIVECKQTTATLLYMVAYLQSLADANVYFGDFESAKNELNSAKLIADENFPNHLEQAYVYGSMAVLAYRMGMYTEAVENVKKFLNIRLTILPKDHYKVGHAKTLLGLMLCASNRLDEGIANLKEAEVIYNKNFESSYYSFIQLYLSISYAFEMRKEYDYALQYLIKAQKIAIQDKNLFSIYIYTFTPIEELPFSLKTKNVVYYMQALDLIKKMFGENHIRTGRYHYLLGLVYANLQKHDEARQHYQKALDIFTRQQFNDKTLVAGHQKNIQIIHKHLQTMLTRA